MELNGSGNLGLGVTPSASSWTSFELLGGNVITSYPSATIPALYSASNAYYNSGWIYKNSANALLYAINANSGQHQWFTAPSGTAGNAITFTQSMALNASGNLLIGTTVDNGNKLQVFGNTYTEGIYVATGQFSQGGSATSTFYTFSNVSSNRVFLVTLRQSGAAGNSVIAMGFTYAGVLAAYNVAQDNTNPALYLTITSTGGLGLQLTTGSGYGTTTWEWTITQIK